MVTYAASHYRARYYDAASGRFLSEDPIGFSGGDLDFYTYVAGSPTNRIDPSGHNIICPFTNPGCIREPQHLSDCAKKILQPYFPGLNLDGIVLTPYLPGFATTGYPIDVGAITWDGIISYQPGQFSGDAAGLAAIGHEITHVQQQNSGLFSFLKSYLGDYFKSLAHGSGKDAYENIRAEKEARAMENRIGADLFRAYKFGTICKDFCGAIKQPDSPW